MRYRLWMVRPGGVGLVLVYESDVLADTLAYLDLRSQMGLVFILECQLEVAT